MNPKHFSTITFLLIITVLFSLPACSTFNALSDIKKPELSISDASITNLSLNDIELTFEVDINNPNPVAVNLKDYNYDFQVNKNSFITGTQTSETEIEASSSSRIQIPVSFSYSELYDMFSTLKGEDETTYEFLLNAGIDAPVLGRFEVPLKKTGTIPVVKMPQINLKNVALENLSFTKADIAVNLVIDNPNNFDLALSELNYNLKLNNSSAFTGTITDEFLIKESSESTVTVPLSFNLLELGSALQSILRDGDEIEYELLGSSKIESSLPMFKPSTFNFDKAGKVNILR